MNNKAVEQDMDNW